jgi:hypothetical protein
MTHQHVVELDQRGEPQPVEHLAPPNEAAPPRAEMLSKGGTGAERPVRNCPGTASQARGGAASFGGARCSTGWGSPR